MILTHNTLKISKMSVVFNQDSPPTLTRKDVILNLLEAYKNSDIKQKDLKEKKLLNTVKKCGVYVRTDGKDGYLSDSKLLALAEVLGVNLTIETIYKITE